MSFNNNSASFGSAESIEKYYTLKDLADLSGIPSKTLRRQIKLGALKAIRATTSSNSPLLVAVSSWKKWVVEATNRVLGGSQETQEVRHA
jgi:hypothetical protein